MAAELFDTHTHYFDERFRDFEGGAEKAIALSKAAGVNNFLICSTSYENALQCLDFCSKDDAFHAAIGLHPEDSFFVQDVHSELEQLKRLLDNEKVCALGEIGLDYHYPEETDKSVQKEVFEAQLLTAEEKKLPVVIHARDAHGDTFDILSAHPKSHGVLHCYSGSPEMARQYAKKGWFFSFGGTITYKNAEKVKESFLQIPKEQILLETDCPYLPPVPHRGKINYSGYLVHTCQAFADLWQVSYEEAAQITTTNAKQLFLKNKPGF